MNLRTVPHSVNVPQELIAYSAANRFYKDLKFLCCLKYVYNPGIIKEEDFDYEKIGTVFGNRDLRTIKKYIKRLRDINWIGYDPKTRITYLRSWKRIKRDLGLKSKGNAVLNLNHIRYFKEFMLSSIVESIIKKAIFYHERVARKIKRKGDRLTGNFAPPKEGAFPTLPGGNIYYGISNGRLCQMFNCSKSRISQIKKRARKAKVLYVRKKFINLGGFPSEPMMPRKLNTAYPEIAGRLSLKSGKNGMVDVFMQSHDELRSMLFFNKNG